MEETKATQGQPTFGLLLVAVLGNMASCMYALHGALRDVQHNLKDCGAEHGERVGAALDKHARSVWNEIRDMPATMEALRRIVSEMLPAQPQAEGGAQ